METGVLENICPLINKKCLKTSCAWWVIEANECSMFGVAQALNAQAESVHDMLNTYSQIR